ncbi:MAG: A24 family peptidase [Patescibacteria group bacterium]|nr:A24 family peptidase [Patescibacteria group bacterium]
MVATVLLLALLVTATVTDVSRRRIYNGTTYLGMLAALGLNAAGSAAVSLDWVRPESLARLGWISLGESLLGWLACGAIMLVCFVLFQVGGGDVKLMAMAGAFLGPQRGLEAMLWTFVAGGCLAVIVLLWRVGPLDLARRALRHVLATLRVGRISRPTEEERVQLRAPLFLAPCALAAAIIVQFSLIPS